MRHTSASLLIKKGVAIKLVSERLGHANVGTTMEIYCHNDHKAHREIAELFRRENKSNRRDVASVGMENIVKPEEGSTPLDYRH